MGTLRMMDRKLIFKTLPHSLYYEQRRTQKVSNVKLSKHAGQREADVCRILDVSTEKNGFNNCCC